jgi:alkanesulfonate monooxygenase SsuD/methylene tetrahydromethanopterin reductase-like flavin-dependent oxidoreductase (luciferase family)
MMPAPVDPGRERPDALAPIGVMHQMWALANQPDRQFLADVVEDVCLADGLGYDSVWLAEHHYVRADDFYSRLPDPEILLARLIPATAKIRLATGIKILALDDPVRTVERLRLLSLLSGGRVLLGVGQGSPDEMGTLSLSTDERRQEFRDRLEAIGGLLRAGVVDGRALTPEVDIHPGRTIWVGARDEASISLAARLGMNFIVGEAEVGVRQARLTEAYRLAGGGGEVRGARLVCVAESDDEAFEAVRGPGRVLHDRFSKGRYYVDAVTAGVIPDTTPSGDREALRRIEYIFGTPDTVAEQLREYIATTRVDALNVLVHSPGMAPAAARRTLRLVMSEVAPRLDSALEANRASVAAAL